MQKSMAAYVKSLSKRNEGDDKEKSLPVANLGSIMVKHGEDFEDDNVFGKCLQGISSSMFVYDLSHKKQDWAPRTSELGVSRKRTSKTHQRAGLIRLRGPMSR